MEVSRSNEIKVGILVGGALLLTIITILFLGGDSKFFTAKYNLTVTFDQVQGLSEGAVVTILGVRVGHVKEITMTEVSGVSRLKVLLEVEQKFQSRITDGSIAGVRTQGALGDKFIYISPGAPDAKPLDHLAELKAESGAGLFETLAENSGKIERLFDVIQEVHKLVSNVNANNKSGILMDNLVQTSSNMKALTAEAHLLIKDLRGTGQDGAKVGVAVQKLANILNKIDSGTGTLGALVNDSSVYEGLKQLVGGTPRNKYFKSIIRETIQTSEK